MNEKFVLVIVTTLMIVNAIMVVIYILAINKTKSDAFKRDLYYAQRFDAIEKMIKENFNEILNLLKTKNN